MIDKVTISDKKKFLKFDDMKRDFPMERPHFHNYYELYYLVSGSCEFSVEDHIFTLTKDDMLLIPPNSIHWAVDYPQMTRRFIVHFSPDCINSEFKKPLSLFTNNNLYIPDQPDHIHQMLQQIRKELKSAEPLSQQVAICHLKLLLTHMIRNTSSSRKPVHRNPSTELVEKMMQYVSACSHTDITINELSKEFGYSESYISRIFKNASGIGFKEYVILQRLKNAELLLRTTNHSVQEIAISCGFNDSNYFSTIFRKKHGMSPSKYRNNDI